MRAKFINERSSLMGDYEEAYFNLDIIFPHVDDISEELFDILDDDLTPEEKYNELTILFEENADYEIMEKFFPPNGSIRGFVMYIMDKDKEL